MPLLARMAVFVLCLLPLAWLFSAAVAGALSPDPAKILMLGTGEWALRLLALTLLVSLLRALTGWSGVMKVRRMLGLFTFFYACMHLLVFLQFYLGWSLAAVAEELVERPFITAGFGAWLLMVPLAMTSTRGMQRRLRGNWVRLHRSVYLVAVLGTLHLLWQARSDLGEALLYALIFASLLLWRVQRHFLRRRTSRSPVIGASAPP